MFKVILVILVVLLVYLNRSYSYFYDFLGEKNLPAPKHQTETVVGRGAEHVIKYVALGDSLTAGVGVLNYPDSYPYQVAERLSAQGQVKLINLGHPGALLIDVEKTQLPRALLEKPDVVTLLIGINDIHNFVPINEFENRYSGVVEALSGSGARVYLLSIPHLGSGNTLLFPYNMLLDFKTRQFNLKIKEISERYDLKYIDIYSADKSEGFYSEDEFHPSALGYKDWMKIIDETIR